MVWHQIVDKPWPAAIVTLSAVAYRSQKAPISKHIEYDNNKISKNRECLQSEVMSYIKPEVRCLLIDGLRFIYSIIRVFLRLFCLKTNQVYIHKI